MGADLDHAPICKKIGKKVTSKVIRVEFHSNHLVAQSHATNHPSPKEFYFQSTFLIPKNTKNPIISQFTHLFQLYKTPHISCKRHTSPPIHPPIQTYRPAPTKTHPPTKKLKNPYCKHGASKRHFCVPRRQNQEDDAER